MLLKLAIQNVKGNKGFFFAYALTIAVLFTIVYNLTNIQVQLEALTFFKDGTMGQFKLADVFGFLKNFMYAVIIFFAAYISRFFIKRRNREIALLKTLGLTRQSIWSMFLIENAIILVIGIAMGLVLGVISSKLFSSVAMTIMGFDLQSAGFVLSGKSFLDAMIIMLIVYVIMAIVPLKAVAKTGIKTLLTEQVKTDVVDKKPFASFLIFIVSTIALVYMAIVVLPKAGLNIAIVFITLVIAIVVAVFLYRGFVLNYFYSFKKKGKGIGKPVKEMAFSHLGASVKGLYKMMAFITVISAVVTAVIVMSFGFLDQMMSVGTQVGDPLMMTGTNKNLNKYEDYYKENNIESSKFQVLSTNTGKYTDDVDDPKNAGDSFVGEVTKYNLLIVSQSTYNDLATFRGFKDVDVDKVVSNVETVDCGPMKTYCDFAKENDYSGILYDKNVDDVMVVGSSRLTFNDMYPPGSEAAKDHNELVNANVIVVPDDVYNKVEDQYTKINVLSAKTPPLKNEFFKYYNLTEKTELIKSADVVMVNSTPLFSIYGNVVVGLFQLIFLFMALVTVIALMMAIFFRTLENMEKGSNEYVMAKQIGMSRPEIFRSTMVEALLSQLLPFVIGMIASIIILNQMLGSALQDGQNILSFVFHPACFTVLVALIIMLLALVAILVYVVNKRINELRKIH